MNYLVKLYILWQDGRWTAEAVRVDDQGSTDATLHVAREAARLTFGNRAGFLEVGPIYYFGEE